MDIPSHESQIISILFHPRIVKYIHRKVGSCGTVMEQIGTTPSHRSVKFAYTLPVGDDADIMKSHVVHWLLKNNMHVICTNVGVVETDDSRIIGIDMLITHEPKFTPSLEGGVVITACTLMLYPQATSEEISDVYAHTQRIQEMLSVSYNISCRSVVLHWGVNGKLSERWL
jgi:hypothetical protein